MTESKLYDYGVNATLLGNDEAMKHMMQLLSDEDLAHFCQMNHANARFCSNSQFWKDRIRMKFNKNINHLPQGLSYRFLYKIMVEVSTGDIIESKLQRVSKMIVDNIHEYSDTEIYNILVFLLENFHVVNWSFHLAVELAKRGKDGLAITIYEYQPSAITYIYLLPYVSASLANRLGEYSLKLYENTNVFVNNPLYILNVIMRITPKENILAYIKGAKIDPMTIVQSLLFRGQFSTVHAIYEESNLSAEQFINNLFKEVSGDDGDDNNEKYAHLRYIITFIVVTNISFSYDQILGIKISLDTMTLLEYGAAIYPTHKYLKSINADGMLDDSVAILTRNRLN